MGGFSDNYECGYWGDETPPMKRNEKVKKEAKSHAFNNQKSYFLTRDENYEYLNFILSPLTLLNDEEQEERTNLTQLCNTVTTLELIENNKEIKIYYDEVFIGSVQKVFEDGGIDNTQIVNDFCFCDDELKEIEAFWSGEVFCFRGKYT